MKTVCKKNLVNRILPGLKLCNDVRKMYPILERRNPASMNAWINNYLRNKNQEKNPIEFEQCNVSNKQKIVVLICK